MPRKAFLVPRLPSKIIILSLLVKNYQKTKYWSIAWRLKFPQIFCSWLYPFFSITYCFNLSRENYDMPKHAPSWKHMYDMLFLSMISIRKHIFSEIKQFFARMKSKEIGVSNDVKINLSIYVTEKKKCFCRIFQEYNKFRQMVMCDN